MSATGPDSFQVAFWGMSILFTLFGLGVTTLGWKVSERNARNLARTKDIHDSINECIKSVSELEDLAYAFWLVADEKAKPYQLVVGHKRLIHRLNQLQSLTNGILPSSDIKDLRRFCTMDCESRTSPIENEDPRIRRISLAASNIIKSSIMQKSWEANLKRSR